MQTRQAKLAYWIFPLVFFVLWACTVAPEPVSTLAATVLPDASPTPTFALPAATPTSPTCLSRPGRLHAITLDSSSIPHFSLYLPPCYDEFSSQRYPVLYLFHGATYDDTQWPRLGTTEAADRLIASGDAAPFIIVMPYDRASWRNPQDDLFDQAVLNALIPYVDTHYRTLTVRSYRAVGGLSRGAGWALRLGLTRPDLFGVIGAHSPVIFYTDQACMRGWLADLPADARPVIYVDIGQSDKEHGAAQQLVDLLDAYQVPYVWRLQDGTHNETYWQTHVEDYLRWYASNWIQP